MAKRVTQAKRRYLTRRLKHFGITGGEANHIPRADDFDTIYHGPMELRPKRISEALQAGQAEKKG